MANYDKYIPSGLTLDDSYAIKILICYFLRQIDRPITHNQLIEIATSAGGVNYFTFSEVVAQMLETGMLLEKEIDGEKYYVLSTASWEGANDFKTLVPKSFRDRILCGIKILCKAQKRQRCQGVGLEDENRLLRKLRVHGGRSGADGFKAVCAR